MSRNVAVTDMLLRATEKGPFHFIGCDSPTFNERTIHILATVAQALYIKISERQKSAMALCRASGMQLGSANPRHWKGLTRGWKKAIHAAAIARSKKATAYYQYVLPQIIAFREAGESLDNICWWLTRNGHTTTVGKPFSQTALWRLLHRSHSYPGRLHWAAGITTLQRERIVAELAPNCADSADLAGQDVAFLGKRFDQEAVWDVIQNAKRTPAVQRVPA